ncbi:S-Ena type endospore appendage [Alkalihalobacillus sp. BA299]|uniref:S-Ena type endospore appendage n=1 Tax=Alkalihalobacillus sp. BA299 TaxID=2815938 RepID=UPI0027DAFE74|nr:S-Ena type endospore appendage [Alkalihalobacillus sp. BA299]
MIYYANQTVPASGCIEVSNMTSNMNQIIMTFLIGSIVVSQFTLSRNQSFTFSVVGFDRVTLQGDAPSVIQEVQSLLL